MIFRATEQDVKISMNAITRASMNVTTTMVFVKIRRAATDVGAKTDSKCKRQAIDATVSERIKERKRGEKAF